MAGDDPHHFRLADLPDVASQRMFGQGGAAAPMYRADKPSVRFTPL